jgi:hypothetical protein
MFYATNVPVALWLLRNDRGGLLLSTADFSPHRGFQSARVYRVDKCGQLSFSDHERRIMDCLFFGVKAGNTDAGLAVSMAVVQREMALAFYF